MIASLHSRKKSEKFVENAGRVFGKDHFLAIMHASSLLLTKNKLIHSYYLYLSKSNKTSQKNAVLAVKRRR